MGFLRGVLSLFVFFSAAELLFASPSNDEASARAQKAKYYTVKVDTDTSEVFNPDPSGGSGTGFIVELKEKSGVIFTNKHVIDRNHLEARRVRLSFNLDDASSKSETIDAEVRHESKFLDFSVIEFDPRKLSKFALSRILLADLPTREEYLKLVEAGRGAMAFGNPLSSRNNATFGTINGFAFGRDWSISKRQFWSSEGYINTDTAINPGNSGGPLVDVETGKVVGINTAVISGANTHGYVTPILPLIEEWEVARKLKTPPSLRRLQMEFEDLSLEGIELVPKLKAIIQKDIPEFFNIFAGAFIVARTTDCGLLPGDIILRVDGEPIGDQDDKLDWMVETSTQKFLPFTIIRNLKKIDVQVRIDTELQTDNASRHEYLISSGVVFQDLQGYESFRMLNGQPGVMIIRLLPFSIGAQMTQLTGGTIVTEVIANGVRTQITTLKDLEKVFRSVDDGTYVMMFVRRALRDEDGRVLSHDGVKLISSTPNLEMFPVTKVVSSKQLPLSKLKKDFDFTGKDIESRLIQSKIDAICLKSVTKLAKTTVSKKGGLSRKT